MERLNVVPKRFRGFDGVDVDNFINLEFKSTTKPSIEYDITNIVNQTDQFEQERIETRDYRFSGKINLYTANELTPTERKTQPNGTTLVVTGALNEDWDPLLDGSPQVTPNNWLLQILYPEKKEPNFNIIKTNQLNPTLNISSLAKQGPQITNFSLAQPSGETEKLGVTTIQKNNLVVDDFVYVYNNGTTPNPYTGVYRVLSLGIDGIDLNNKFVLDTPFNGDYTQPSNYRKIVNVTQNDINFSNNFDIQSLTATDIDGNTSGSFLPTEKIYTKIKTQVPHKLSTGFTVSPTYNTYSTSNTIPKKYQNIDLRGEGILNGIFYVTNVIDDFNFTIELTYFTTKGQTQQFLSNNPKFRALDGTPSDYYVRKYKVLSTNQYDVYDCAFSSSIYPKTIVNNLGIANKTWLYHFNKDFNLGPLLDHNNKPLTELYLGLIKRAGQNTFPWSDVVADWDFNYESINNLSNLETISKVTSGGVGTIEKPDENFYYIGDYAEYNSLEIEEKVISKIVHRFGLESTPNEEGYYLEPFKRLEIMNFSNLIEYSNIRESELTEGIPNYAEVYPNGEIAWRDFLPIGFIEPDNGVGVDYPFVNGRHYFYGNYNFFIRRQFNPIKNDNEIRNKTIKIAEIEDIC